MEQISTESTTIGRISLEELTEAYYTCRKNKRNTASAIKFEMNLASNLVDLWQDINQGTYHPGRSIAFVVTKPVCREVFAAQFRDLIVHHLIINKLEALMEQYFIDDSYSCRRGKGAFYGQKRVQEMIRECSHGYTQDCWVMKLDIKSFFMSIDKKLLYQCMERFVETYYHAADKEQLLWLIRVTIFHRPELDCERHSPDWFWDLLPKEKSLFGTDGSHGLPIGNHTSQMFAMLFLTEFAFVGVDGSMDENMVSQPAVKKKKEVKSSTIEELDHDSLVKELVREIVAQMKEGYKLQVGLVK